MPGNQMSYIPLWQLVLSGGLPVVLGIMWVGRLQQRLTEIERVQDGRTVLLERLARGEQSLIDMLRRIDRLERITNHRDEE